MSNQAPALDIGNGWAEKGRYPNGFTAICV
jgi:hypothetical protein